MTNVHYFIVNKILKEKKIHCLEFAINQDIKSFIEQRIPCKQNNKLILDFSWISDDKLLKQLVLFLISIMNETSIQTKQKYQGYLMAINRMKIMNAPRHI